ncbi:MAG TPA: flippase [Chitinophagaceae bacterium]|nr:flippase [Chitinophagaceae bacterium]
MFLLQRIKSLYANEGFKKYLANTSWLFGEKLARLVIGLIVSAYVARYLGAENFGVINYAISFVAIFTSFSTLGSDEIVINKLLQKKYDQNVLLGTSFILRLLAFLLAIIIITITLTFFSNDVSNNIYILIIASGIVFQPFNVIDLYFQSRVQSKYIAIASLVSLIINSMLRLYFIYIKAPLTYFVGLLVLENLILAIGLIFFYYRNNNSILTWKYNKDIAKKIFYLSLPLMLSTVIITIYMKIDQLIIKEKLDLSSVGNYSAAARISELWYFIPMTIGSSLFPAIINAKKNNEILYKKRLQQLFDLMVVLSLAIAIAVSFSSDWIIATLYGYKFSEAADVLTIHIWAGVFVFIGVANSKFTIIENLTRIALYRTLLGVSLNIVLNLVLIPKLGIRGAAISVLVSQFMSSYFSSLFWKKTRPSFLLATKSLTVVSLVKRFFSENKTDSDAKL